MQTKAVAEIIRNYMCKKNYRMEERPSLSSGSWYFKVYSGEDSLLFRISDHGTKSDVITLRTDKKLSEKLIKNFVDNRCDDLRARSVKKLLGL